MKTQSTDIFEQLETEALPEAERLAKMRRLKALEQTRATTAQPSVSATANPTKKSARWVLCKALAASSILGLVFVVLGFFAGWFNIGILVVGMIMNILQCLFWNWLAEAG